MSAPVLAVLSSQNARKGNTSGELSPSQLFLSGAGAGLSNSIISGPVEHVRIRLQTQPSLPLNPTSTQLGAHYSGPWDVCRKIFAKNGLKGVFYGQNATLIRESVGYGIYFAAYEGLVQRKMRNERITRKELPATSAVLLGAAAGYAMWFTCYPLDAIKYACSYFLTPRPSYTDLHALYRSKIQADGLPSEGGKKRYHGYIDCIRKTLATQGIRGFYKGLIPTLIRSPFANGTYREHMPS